MSSATTYYWTYFELLPGATHESAGKWLDAHGYHCASYHRDSPIHTRHMDAIDNEKLQALLAEDGCPVKYPPSKEAVQKDSELRGGRGTSAWGGGF